jgi:hypothetical protein
MALLQARNIDLTPILRDIDAMEGAQAQRATNYGYGLQGRALGMTGRRAAGANAIRGLGGQAGLIGQGLWNHWRTTFKPLNERLAALADFQPGAYAEQAEAEAANKFDVARQNIDRELRARGAGGLSGANAGLLTEIELAKAAGTAGAYRRAWTEGEGLRFNRTMGAAGVGAPLPGQALGALGQAINAQAQAGAIDSGIAELLLELSGEAGQHAGYLKHGLLAA